MLHILNKHLTNEKKWLSYTSMIASGDMKIKAGVEMAKERVPQLESAIKIISQQSESPKVEKTERKKSSRLADSPTKPKQLNLFNHGNIQ